MILSAKEEDELEHYFILEHIVRLAKSRARLILSKGQLGADIFRMPFEDASRNVQCCVVNTAGGWKAIPFRPPVAPVSEAPSPQ